MLRPLAEAYDTNSVLLTIDDASTVTWQNIGEAIQCEIIWDSTVKIYQIYDSLKRNGGLPFTQLNGSRLFFDRNTFLGVHQQTACACVPICSLGSAP